MKSMTGFGRAEVQTSFGRIVTEIQSVNRKHLEVNISMPKDFQRFESVARKLVNESISRGSISLRIHFLPNPEAIEFAMPNSKTLIALKENWENLAASLGFDRSVITLSFLLKCAEDLPQYKEVKEEDFHPFAQSIQNAIDALESMKEVEGSALAVDVLGRIVEIEQWVKRIEKATPDTVGKLRLKLQERMQEVLTPGIELDERVLREVAIFAERLDIAEEITRFRSHIEQYKSILESKKASGRKMDFLVQEMGREINTMGSKSADAKIAHLVVEVKSELEKIREQIQNIE